MSFNLVGLCFVLLTALLSLLANSLVQAGDVLPMQWDFKGKPTWYAPRLVALGFIPLLSFAVYLILSSASFIPGKHATPYCQMIVPAALLCANGLYVVMLTRRR